MGKLVVLKFDGELQQGLRVSLEISEDGQYPYLETHGQLPANPHIISALQQWRNAYQNLVSSSRSIQPLSIQYGGHISSLETCTKVSRSVADSVQSWFRSPDFRAIDLQLRDGLSPHDSIRILIRSSDRILHQIPWHLWDLFDSYPQAEVVLGASRFRPASTLPRSRLKKVRILLILGDRTGINIEADQQLLSQLPDVQITTLLEPSRQALHEQLYDQPWDIVFFAGHSQTIEGEGILRLNASTSLTLDEIRYSIRRAIANGLSLAIFNSCDGLGLAAALESEQLPQLIVMRQAVPDRVAQIFLTYFLQAFSRGEWLHTAMREAREKLQGLEDQFPCASWLPILYQHPTAAPLSWQSFLAVNDQRQENHRHAVTMPIPSSRLHPPIAHSILIILGVALGIIGIRGLGWLQRWELYAYDQLLRLRPAEVLDQGIVVVEITETDINRYGYPVPDGVLAEAIDRLESYNPRLIGLDIFRDRPVGDGHNDLIAKFESSRVIGICSAKVTEDLNRPGIAAPPSLPSDRLGFSNVVVDPDGILRRQLMFMHPKDPSCDITYSLSSRLAFQLLNDQGITPQDLPNHRLQLGEATFQPLDPSSGAYHHADHWGYQVMLNYANIDAIAHRVHLTDVLSGNVAPYLLEDQLVLIGVVAPVSNPSDFFRTPISAYAWPEEKVPGVHVQAQMVHHLLSAAQGDRPTITPMSPWIDGLWILLWGMLGYLPIRCVSRRFYLGMSLIGAVAGLITLSYGFLVLGLWLPLVPTGMSLIFVPCGIKVYQIYRQGLQSKATFVR